MRDSRPTLNRAYLAAALAASAAIQVEAPEPEDKADAPPQEKPVRLSKSEKKAARRARTKQRIQGGAKNGE